MATYTANYGLHQWVPEDVFVRTDFNTDLSKIDAGLKTAQDTADSAASAAAAAQSTANTANTNAAAAQSTASNAVSAATAAQSAASTAQETADSKIGIVVGNYRGDGEAERIISLGFKPKAVIVEVKTGNRNSHALGGLAIPGTPCGGIEIVTEGFQCSYGEYSESNVSGYGYQYIAFR
ncbi:hypothetical protein [Pseudoflavonifractor phocaeensis]|uniref:hypothetical protein n=1 Tax=Pseudoflavonifractor phocaeensis TaxID=1870988 RepID=UPI00195A2C4A|nr:hypothetical protein [Pseudoflavonifractor phocaeensis]MBM6927452.1 hypothetical protein [Pseudoflavonifractor phocaeensis]